MLYTRPFLALALANFCISSSGGAFFLFPLFVLDRGGSAADIGVVMGAFALASTLCRPGVAAWIDRLGRKRAMPRTTALFVRDKLRQLAVAPCAPNNKVTNPLKICFLGYSMSIFRRLTLPENHY